jgi:hypothetical protein
MKPVHSKLICSVSSRLALAEYEKLAEMARAKEVSTARLIRKIIQRELASCTR